MNVLFIFCYAEEWLHTILSVGIVACLMFKHKKCWFLCVTVLCRGARWDRGCLVLDAGQAHAEQTAAVAPSRR